MIEFPINVFLLYNSTHPFANVCIPFHAIPTTLQTFAYKVQKEILIPP